MIDFHCHFLPGIDDGAESVEESIGILEELRKQGVCTVVATPHFSAENESVEEFIARRNEAYEKVPAAGIKVLLGAEVRIVPELMDEDEDSIRKLCIENSECILLEMPYAPWQQWMFDVVGKLEKTGLTVVIAHAERYYENSNLFKYRRFFELENLYIQFNADSFLSMIQRRIVKLFLNKEVRAVIGSDAHDLRARKPRIEKAKKMIETRFEKDLMQKMQDNAKSLLKEGLTI